MTDAPPSYHIDDPPVYSPMTCQSLTNPTIYHIKRLSLGDYEIHTKDQRLEFYVEIHNWKVSKPDLRMYRGNKESGHKVAECRYGENDSPSRCDTGWIKSSQESHHLGGKMSVAWWTRSTQNSLHPVQYRFAAMVQQSPDLIEEDGSGKTPRTFVWTRSTNLMLLDEETGSVVALAHENQSDLSTCGSLEITASYGDEFYSIALSTYIIVCEQQRSKLKSSFGDRREERLGGKIGAFVEAALKRR